MPVTDVGIMSVQQTNRLPGCHPSRGANIKGRRASDELFNASCKPAANASHYGPGHACVLLRRATSLCVLKPCCVRRALNDQLSTALFQYEKSVTTTVKVTITATVPNKAMGRTTLGVIEPVPRLDSGLRSLPLQ